MDKKFSDLPSITGASVDSANDLLCLSDISEGESKGITPDELREALGIVDPEYAFCRFDSTLPTAIGTVSTSTTNLLQFESATIFESSNVTIDTTNRRIDLPAGTFNIIFNIQMNGTATTTSGSFQLHDGTNFLPTDAEAITCNPLGLQYPLDANSQPTNAIILNKVSSWSLYVQPTALNNANIIFSSGSTISIHKL